jgi:hypothetical protein
MIAIGETTSSTNEEIQWGLFPIGGLTNGEEASVDATHLGSGLDKTWISRSSVARWVLDEAIAGKWIGKSPYNKSESGGYQLGNFTARWRLNVYNNPWLGHSKIFLVIDFLLVCPKDALTLNLGMVVTDARDDG